MTQLLVLPTPAIHVHHRENYPYSPYINITDRKLTNPSPSKAVSPFRTNHKFDDDELPRDFKPGPFDVICSQGKSAKAHPGNIYFQSVIHKSAKEYASAIEKRRKSKIVRTIIDTIRTNSPNSGFVKKASDGRWWVVGLDQAREKVSQSLRDTLAGHYRSSLLAKKRMRAESNVKRMIDFEEIIATNQFVSERTRLLSETIKNCNDSDTISSLCDSDMLNLMTESNLSILRQLKIDQTVQQEVGVEQPKQEEKQDKCKTALPSLHGAVDDILIKFHTDDDFMLLQQPASKRCKK